MVDEFLEKEYWTKSREQEKGSQEKWRRLIRGLALGALEENELVSNILHPVYSVKITAFRGLGEVHLVSADLVLVSLPLSASSVHHLSSSWCSSKLSC